MRRYWYIVIISLLGFSCASQDLDNPISDIPLPYLKNSPGECYYLDEFMPIPEALVAGKKGRLYLRYYTYRSATYKDWEQKHVVLSFYPQDERCWSLFEEYYVQD